MKKETESTITKPLCSTSAPNKDPVSDSFEPQTPLGQKLLMLRKSYVEKGYPLLNNAEFDKELISRRGGVLIGENTQKDVNQAIENFFNNMDSKKL